MKALSVWQPWASLIAMGLKRFETRGWSTNYRGPLLICSATKRLDSKEREFDLACCTERDFYLPNGHLTDLDSYFLDWDCMNPRTPSYTNLPFGKALCIVDLSRVWTTNHVILSSWPSIHDMNPPLSAQELSLGDYSSGRFAWELMNVRRFKKPWPIRGRQGLLFNVPDEEIAKHGLEE